MSEISPPSSTEGRAETRKRNLIILASIIPIVALFALLGWAAARSGGSPAGLGIYYKFGEITVEQRPAPEFVKEGLTGSTVNLAELRGKVVMLDFWSSWCPPCRREAPVLAQVYREYEGEDVEFIGVAIWDDRGKVARHVQEFDLTYPNVVDDRGRIGIDYGVTGIPEKFFIDTNGNLAKKFVGPMKPETLRAALDGLLAPLNTDLPGGEG